MGAFKDLEDFKTKIESGQYYGRILISNNSIEFDYTREHNAFFCPIQYIRHEAIPRITLLHKDGWPLTDISMMVADSLMEIQGNLFTIYYPSERPFNKEEIKGSRKRQAVLGYEYLTRQWAVHHINGIWCDRFKKIVYNDNVKGVVCKQLLVYEKSEIDKKKGMKTNDGL